MQDGTEGEAVSPRRAEVGDFNAAVPSGDVLTPLEQRLAGVHQSLQEERGSALVVCVCVCVCLCILCVFTSAASSFPSVSSLTGTGRWGLRSEVSSSGNVGSREVFISQ